ncbi:MAG TPA: co-chaperone GroES [Thermodesulfovibrionia bacterium]|nr:co-chaperone GroES [Thermodesulfovibrionia bacterium]
MNVKPLHDWALLKEVESEEKTGGGLFIPDSAKEKPQKGIVERVGPGRYEQDEPWKRKKKKDKKAEKKFIPTEVKPGQTVLFERYAAKKVRVGNQDMLMVREKNMLAVFE